MTHLAPMAGFKISVAWIVAAGLCSVASASVVERIVAVVDREVITLSQIYDLGGGFINERCPEAEPTCVWQIETEVLDALIQRSLVGLELKRLELRVGAADIDMAIDRILRDYNMPDRDALRAEVERSGVDWETYREQLGEQITVQRFQSRVLAPRVSVTEDELKDRFQRTQRKTAQIEAVFDAFGVPLPSAGDDALIAETVRQTELVVEDLRSGELAWDEAVKRFDGAGLSDAIGGRPFRKGELTPALDAAVFAAEPGDVVGPFRVGSVLFVVRLARRGAGAGGGVDFSAVKEQLRDELFTEKLKFAEEEWYQRARRQAAVQVLLPKP